MLAFLTTCPFYDWGENWPAGFQEENVNHGLAGLMTPCLSLMLISVNWGPCTVLEGFGKSLRTVELSMLPLLLLTPEQKHLCADGVSLFALHSLSEPICFHHNDSHSLGLIFTVIQGVSFFFGGGRGLWCPHIFLSQIWAKMLLNLHTQSSTD